MWTAAARAFKTPGGTAYQTAGHKDDTRYLREVDYKAGYDQGFNACFQEEKAHPKIKSDGGARSLSAARGG